MPLTQSASREAFEKNLKAELAAKKPRDQALAIAYSVQRRNRRADGGLADFQYIPDPPLSDYIEPPSAGYRAPWIKRPQDEVLGVPSAGIGVAPAVHRGPPLPAQRLPNSPYSNPRVAPMGGWESGPFNPIITDEPPTPLAAPGWISSRADGGGLDTWEIARASGGVITEMPAVGNRRFGARPPYGFSVGTGGGRTDKNNVAVGSGSYVLPADVVAGLGEGNSVAGAAMWGELINSMPWGIDPQKMRLARRGPPAAPRGMTPPWAKRAEGGLADFDGGMMTGHNGGPPLDDEPEEEEVPIVAADGEIIVSPEEVLRVAQHYAPEELLESGDYEALLQHGHDLLDHFVKEQRGRTIAHLKSLKGPVGSKDEAVGHNKVAT